MQRKDLMVILIGRVSIRNVAKKEGEEVKEVGEIEAADAAAGA
jgi:hypothetical protein